MADFDWATLGSPAFKDVGLGITSGLTNGLEVAGNAKIANANAYSQDVVNRANNEVQRSKRDLAATVRSINNARVQNTAKDTIDTLSTNALRTADAFTRRDFESSIQHAESWGRAAVAGAASGLGGAGIDAISRATSLQIARDTQNQNEQETQALGDQAQQINGVMSRALQGLAQGPLVAQQNFSVATQQPVNSGIANSLIQGLISKNKSLQVGLGGLPGSSSEGAQGTPVTGGSATGTDLPPAEFSWADTSAVSPYEDTQRLLNRAPAPYYATQADVRRIDNNLNLN